MPFKDPEKYKQYMKQYKSENKENIKQYLKQYKSENKENIKQYNKTPERIKKNRIANWKIKGLQCNYIEELYQHYLLSDQCENCMCILTVGSKKTPNTKCLDHSHITGEFRNILCNSCNVKRRESNF